MSSSEQSLVVFLNMIVDVRNAIWSVSMVFEFVKVSWLFTSETELAIVTTPFMFVCMRFQDFLIFKTFPTIFAINLVWRDFNRGTGGLRGGQITRQEYTALATGRVYFRTRIYSLFMNNYVSVCSCMKILHFSVQGFFFKFQKGVGNAPPPPTAGTEILSGRE